MKRQILGLDINDEHVAAVVVGSSGQDRVITGSGFARFDSLEQLAEILPPLLEFAGWRQGTSICGISLSGISLRNLTIPFGDKRKIAQVLPLELEDQLIRPVGDQVIEYAITAAGEERSSLMIAALAKEQLREKLDLLTAAKLSPAVITLRSVALAEQLLREQGAAGTFLLIDAGLHSINMVIAGKGRPVFSRRLAYPDGMFTAGPFALGENGPEIANHDDASACVAAMCEGINRSIGLYRIETETDLAPEKIYLSGSLSRAGEVREKMEAEFGQPVQICDLQKQLNITLSPEARENWNPSLGDHALALALEGFRKKTSFNFRKDEFAPPKLLITRGMAIMASILAVLLLGGTFGYLGTDYKDLDARNRELGQRMETLYRETFPEATRIVDPLVQMKTRVREVQAPSIETPIFSGDKRTLNILADISGRIPPDVEIHVARLTIDNESVIIKGTTDTFNNVNKIQASLQESPLYSDVDIVSATSEKDTGLIRFELKLETAAKI